MSDTQIAIESFLVDLDLRSQSDPRYQPLYRYLMTAPRVLPALKSAVSGAASWGSVPVTVTADMRGDLREMVRRSFA